MEQPACGVDLRRLFFTASGSIIGTRHVAGVRNNQDGSFVIQQPGAIVAVVSDGCSEGESSEVGAKFMSIVVARALARAVMPDGTIGWENARYHALHTIETLLTLLGSPPSGSSEDQRQRREDANRLLMATMVAAVITPTITEVAAIGDGYAAVNGVPLAIQRAADDHPTYLTYAALGTSMPEARLRWQYLRTERTEAVTSVLIGTDGLHDLADVADHDVPVVGGKVGPVEQFVNEARYGTNRSATGRRLTLIQGGLTTQHGLRPGGLLPDDTTLVAIRRVSLKSSAYDAVQPSADTTTGGAA